MNTFPSFVKFLILFYLWTLGDTSFSWALAFSSLDYFWVEDHCISGRFAVACHRHFLLLPWLLLGRCHDTQEMTSFTAFSSAWSTSLNFCFEIADLPFWLEGLQFASFSAHVCWTHLLSAFLDQNYFHLLICCRRGCLTWSGVKVTEN